MVDWREWRKEKGMAPQSVACVEQAGGAGAAEDCQTQMPPSSSWTRAQRLSAGFCVARRVDNLLKLLLLLLAQHNATDLFEAVHSLSPFFTLSSLTISTSIATQLPVDTLSGSTCK